jgi:hypothetical protein
MMPETIAIVSLDRIGAQLSPTVRFASIPFNSLRGRAVIHQYG